MRCDRSCHRRARHTTGQGRLVTVDSPDTARATTCFATYHVDGYTEGSLVAPRLPANIGHYEDTFRRVDGIWLLASRTLVLPYGGPTERLDSPAQS
ncbi:nuclear transport factor 2 family protein [Streptomyces sp. NPDC007971]|uniref:nuclear transport factor 2 family protein n=1 Tax=Streptomyces sp. NPDC007971 TaxID=3364799 RepID=UPI0036DFEF52